MLPSLAGMSEGGLRDTMDITEPIGIFELIFSVSVPISTRVIGGPHHPESLKLASFRQMPLRPTTQTARKRLKTHEFAFKNRERIPGVAGTRLEIS